MIVWHSLSLVSYRVCAASIFVLGLALEAAGAQCANEVLQEGMRWPLYLLSSCSEDSPEVAGVV